MYIIIGNAKMWINNSGCLSSLTVDGKNLLCESLEPQAFVQIGYQGKLRFPLSCIEEDKKLHFVFPESMELTLSFSEKEGYAAFEVTEISGQAEVLIVGPIFTSLAESVGDIIGIAQGMGVTLGVQALNAKTLGGFPAEFNNDVSPLISEIPVSELSVAPLPYYECAAYFASFQNQPLTALQLYSENRCRVRTREIMGIPGYIAEELEEKEEGCILGTSFAFFCCSSSDALEQIGRIEEAEGLPHPFLNGRWAKTNRSSMKSYLIAEFNPDNFYELMEYTKKAGFSHLYHPEPFSSWGHFELRKDCFPDGDASLTSYCDLAKRQGLSLGLHTLSTFTTTSDSYVTPIPSPHLALIGSSPMTASISASDTEIRVSDTVVFESVTSLNTIRIEDELIHYEEVQNGVLTGIRRGEFGTAASSHLAGCNVSLLRDHPYRVFFPDFTLQKEYSRRIGELFLKTGAAQISFDGLEGCAATGEDAYSINRFCLDCFQAFGNLEVINDASRLNHNLWHMHTRMNWGEPWGTKMREGMLEYRIKNQDFYRRNLFPRMLGWFLIRKADRKFEATPPEDMEWALSMAAGFDAGFALSTSSAVLQTNGCSDELLRLISEWEMLRLKNCFPDDLKSKLCDPKSEWHLEKTNDTNFSLYPLSISQPFICDLLELQPGQPGGSDWVLINPFREQEYEFRLFVNGNGAIHNPSFITKKGILRFSAVITGGQYLWYRNGHAYITDRNYKILEEISAVGKGIAQTGQQAFSFSCDFSGEEGPEITVRVFTKDEPYQINLSKSVIL